MSSLVLNQTSFPQSFLESSSTQKAPLGSTMHLGDGRVFRYSENGAVALLANRLVQSSVRVDNHNGTGLALGTAVAGAKSIAVTLGATLATENQYAEGYFTIVNSTDVGTIPVGPMKVSGHAAVASGGVMTCNLADPLPAAIIAADTGALIAHPNKGTLITPAAGTASVVGIAPIDVPASEFYWVQVRGVAACLQDGAFVEGNYVTQSDGVIGAIGPATAGLPIDEMIIGLAVSDTATGDIGLVNMTLG